MTTLEIVLFAMLSVSALAVWMQSKKIQRLEDAFYSVHNMVCKRAEQKKIEHNGLASHDIVIQELEEIADIINETFEEI